MAAAAGRLDTVADEEILDVDTSAAVMCWLETARVPEGIRSDEWERWVDGGCRGAIHAAGVVVTSTMLGNWARTGSLR